MSAVDPIVAVLNRLDRPAQPRAEFAESLRARLLIELEGGPAAAPPPSRRRPLPTAPARLRLALIILALLLVLAAIAAAAYFGVKEWISTGPRGVQVTSDYQLTSVFRDSPARSRFWVDFALGSGGRDLYGLRQAPPHPQRRADLVRVPGVASAAGHVEPERVLSLDSLSRRSELWDPVTDLTNAVVGPYAGSHLEAGGQVDPLAAADNGDVFIVAGVWRRRDEFKWLVPPLSAALLVRHGDGSVEKVLTLRELAHEELPEANPVNLEVEIAASQPGSVWLKVRAGEPTSTTAKLGRYSVLEVVDPNGDGHWSDRSVRRISLPKSIIGPGPRESRLRLITQIEATPDARAFVVGVAPRTTLRGRFRVFRVEDRNGDGDATDPDEVAVLLNRSNVDLDPPPTFAVRPGPPGGLVVAGLTRRTRISQISGAAETADIGRSFAVLMGVLAGPGGDIFAIRQTYAIGRTVPSKWIVYRLSPSRSERSARTPTKPEAQARKVTPGDGARIVFALESATSQRGRILTVRADGRGGPRQLIPGEFNYGFCQSAHAKRIGYYSDAEAPHEPFLYVADADGTDPQKITEEQVGFLCGFNERWLLLTKESGGGMTLTRSDLRTGTNTELVRKVDSLALSQDGIGLLYVDGRGLWYTNVSTLEERRLVGAPARGSYHQLTWSPDGRRIAYTIDPSSARQRILEIRDVAGGSPVLRLGIGGRRASVSWSPDGTRLLACVTVHGSRPGCSGEPPSAAQSRLLLVDIASGHQRLVVRDVLLWAGWSPTGGYGYATPRAVVAVGTDGEVRKLAGAPKRTRPGNWLGFSPDGRYIGLGDFSSRIGVVDVETGKLRIVMRERAGREFISYRKWWRQ